MDVFVLLDVSGSMMSRIAEAVDSINRYAGNLPKPTKITLVIFDDDRYQVIRDTTAGSWDTVSVNETKPIGSTPLYDSCAKLIVTALSRNPEKAVLVIMTDGYENASENYTKSDVKNLLSVWERLKYEVVFLGADFDSVETQSGDLGISKAKTLNFGEGNYARGMDLLSASTFAYATNGVAMNFTDEVKSSLLNK